MLYFMTQMLLSDVVVFFSVTVAFEAGSPGNQAGLKLAVFEDDLRLLILLLFPPSLGGLRAMYCVGPSSVSNRPQVSVH